MRAFIHAVPSAAAGPRSVPLPTSGRAPQERWARDLTASAACMVPQGALLVAAHGILARLNHPRPDRVLALLGALTGSLNLSSRRPSGSWVSDITDDGTPFEFSLGFKRSEVAFRVLWEAQPDRDCSTPEAFWAAAEAVNATASSLVGLSAEHLERIKDRFAPISGLPLRFAMWHAADFDSRGNCMLKVYLNPAASPRPLETTLDALCELGQAALADEVVAQLEARPQDQVLYFSVDLRATSEARVKVYLAHADATTGDLERILAPLRVYAPGEATRTIHGICGSHGPFSERPVLTCLASRGRGDLTATMHFPARCYVERDADVLAGLSALLPEAQLSLLEKILTEDLGMPPARGRGAISYVSRQWSATEPKTTVYLQPHLFQPYGASQ